MKILSFLNFQVDSVRFRWFIMNCTVEMKRLHGSKLFVPSVNICGAQGRFILVPRFCPNLVMKSYEYYPSLCGGCHQGPGSPSSPLLRCSKCQIYCSRDYQSKDWKKGHKGTLFSHCQPFWGKISFLQWRSVFIFPPVCRKVGCFSPGHGGRLCERCLSLLVLWWSSYKRR